MLAAMLPLVAVPVATAATMSPTTAETTVLTLSPFSTDSVMANQLQGSMCRTPNKCVPVDWSPRLYVPAGVTALDTAMGAQSDGPYTVFAYSQGAEVVEQWLKQHADDPNAPDPADVKFVLIGNPTRPYGGTGSFFGEVLPQTDYQVVDVSREYDWASDFPNKPLSPFFVLAVVNAAAGLAIVHLDYTDVNIDDPANTVWTEGKTTYILVPTPTLPLLAPLQAMGVDTAPLNAVLKPMVDSAYDRTYGGRVTLPPEPVTAVASTRSAPSAVAVKPAVNDAAPAPSAAPVPAPPSVAVNAAEEDTATPTPAANTTEKTAPATTRTTGGNKFEPQLTGSRGTPAVGGQKRPASTFGRDIGSTLGKIVKDVTKALGSD